MDTEDGPYAIMTWRGLVKEAVVSQDSDQTAVKPSVGVVYTDA